MSRGFQGGNARPRHLRLAAVLRRSRGKQGCCHSKQQLPRVPARQPQAGFTGFPVSRRRRECQSADPHGCRCADSYIGMVRAYLACVRVLKSCSILAGWLLLSSTAVHADITLLLEEPYGAFGGMTPTGHAAIYLSRVCADTPVSLRRCTPGEPGVVLSRYHKVAGYDWLAIPPIPYFYAVERADQVPDRVDAQEVAALRDLYRRAHLEEFVPDELDGSMPRGDWTQLVGESYDRTIYTFGLETT